MKKLFEVLTVVILVGWFVVIMTKGSNDILSMFLPIQAVDLLMYPLILLYVFLSGFLSLEIIDYFKKDYHGKSSKEKMDSIRS